METKAPNRAVKRNREGFPDDGKGISSFDPYLLDALVLLTMIPFNLPESLGGRTPAHWRRRLADFGIGATGRVADTITGK